MSKRRMTEFMNEKESKVIFEGGFKKYNYRELSAFSRYARIKMKWSKDKIEKSIRVKFFDAGYNLVLLRDTIHKVVLLSSKYDFLETDVVSITVSEMEKIKTVKERKYQKALFAILVFSKKGGLWVRNTLYFNGEIKDIIKKVGVNFKTKEFNDFLFFAFGQNHFIEYFIRKQKGSWRIAMADTDPNSDVYCAIREFDRVQDYLPRFCNECGKEISSKNKYCKEHSGRNQRRKRSKLEESVLGRLFLHEKDNK